METWTETGFRDGYTSATQLIRLKLCSNKSHGDGLIIHPDNFLWLRGKQHEHCVWAINAHKGWIFLYIDIVCGNFMHYRKYKFPPCMLYSCVP